MTQQRATTRRVMMIACAASAAAVACGDSEGDGTTSGASGGSGGGNTGGNGTGGSNSGGTASGGNNAGGSAGDGGSGNASQGGQGGSVSSMCGAMLVVKGSNYASDPHDIMIPLEDFDSTETKIYTSTGNNHTHNVAITAEEFAALRNGETVKKYVCFTQAGFTDHEWVISCADPDIEPTFEGEIGVDGNCPAS